MSSSSRRRRDLRGALAAALVVTAVSAQWLGVSGAAADQLDVVAVVPAAGQVSLVASVAPPPDPALGPESFSVTAAGAPLSVRAMPVVSDQLSVVVVVDASAAGGPALQDGLKGAAAFLLQLPTRAQVSVVTDSDVPTVVAPPAAGPKDALSGLNAIRSAGERKTSDALRLALRQLPAATDAAPRVVLLYTSAADAAGEAAADLAGRFKQAGALLAVVTPGASTPYWSSVARETGGVAASTDHGTDAAAFDRLTAALNGRYLLVVPSPEQLPATVSVRVDTAAGQLSADATVPSPPARWSTGSGGPGLLVLTLGLGVLVLAAGVVVPLYVRSGSRTQQATGGVTPAGHDRPAPRAARAGRSSATAPAPARPGRSAPVPQDAAPAWQQELARRARRESDDPGTPTGSERSEPPDWQRPVERPRARPAAERPVPASDPRTPTYADLDAQVAHAATEVHSGLLDRRRAVAQLALAARGRADLLDRIIESERRMTDSALDRSPPTATVLDLLSAARRVSSGDTALVGPGGVRVEQTVLRTQHGPRTLLRLSRNGGPVLHRWTVEELAQEVDLSTLTEDPHWDPSRD